jgi:hypothetical protein
MKANRKLEFVFNDIFWRCGDCDNVYSIDIKHCVNEIIDGWVAMEVISKQDIKESGWIQ